MATKTISEKNRAILDCVDRWKETACDQIDWIGGWRDATTSPFDRGCNNPLPPSFEVDTEHLVVTLLKENPAAKVEPFLQIRRAIESWYEDRGSLRVPPQNELIDSLEYALAACDAIVTKILDQAAEDQEKAQAATVTNGDEAKETPALTEIERTILQVLGEYDPGILLTAQQISDATKDPEVEIARYVGLSSTKNSIRKLIMRGLAERPEGDKAGARLTTKGRLALAKLRPSLTKINPK